MPRLLRLTAFLIGLTPMLPVVQAQSSRPQGPWKGTTNKRGDTTIVRTASGSVWGEPVRLVEELRIGTRDGDGPDVFGFIWAFALFPDGVMAVFDQSVPALRLFDSAGKYLRTIGRTGSGPGEYRAINGLAVDRDGVLLVTDPRNSRINRWREDGAALPAWGLLASGALLTRFHGLQVDTAGNTYALILSGPPTPNSLPPFGLVRFDRNGRILDTLSRPTIEGPDDPPRTAFAPGKHWILTRTGHAVTGFSGTYSVTVAGPRGAVRMDRAVARVPLPPDERRNYQELMDARTRTGMIGTGPEPSPVPAQKPYYSLLQADLDGRIWVQLHVRSEPFNPPPSEPRPGMPQLPPIRWREPAVVWDVFEPNGRYLGQLEFPPGTDWAEAKGNTVWAIVRGEDDEQYVVRYRISGIR